MTLRSNQTGFTLVEMLVVVPITLIVCVVLLSVLVSKNGELYERNARVSLRMEGLNLLDKLQDELTFSNKFNATLINDLDDPNEPNGGWDYDSTPSNTLIISLPAIDKPRSEPSRQFVYYTTGPNNGDIAINNIIYYVSDGNLYRRVVTPDPADVAPANFFKKTCPPGDNTPNCQDDLEMSSKVETLSVTYFDENNIAVQNNPNLADKIKVTLNLTDMANGNVIDEAVSITVKKYNDF